MIVKLWPIKADYGSKPGKTGGMEGLKNTVDYISDPEKTGDQSVAASLDTRKDSYINQERDIHKVIRYMANQDKIENKYISGYRCSPQLAVAEFENVMTHYGKKAKGNIAYHMVQSFPEDLEISDEEVHQCGLELCEKLGLYQAVVCSHVHPVLDDDGALHGACKHNHILFNAYPLPSVRHPNARGPLKYHDCKATYRQLQIWNDEIAMDHGFPIIRTPDMERTYSWAEADAINKGVSWKERIRMDIENAKKATTDWTSFITYMASIKYKIREGKQITYITPDGKHRARGSTLGKDYTKEGLELYWKLRTEVLQKNGEDIQLNAAPSLPDLTQLGARTVAVPLGKQGIQNRQYYYLELERTALSSEALNSYFEPKQLYEVCDEKEQVVGVVSGAEIIAYYQNRDSDWLRNERAAKEEDIASNNERKRQAEKEKKEKEDEPYYSNTLFRSSRTKKPYRVSYYDRNGRRIGSAEAILRLAIAVLVHEDGLWIPSTVPPNKMYEICYATTNWKLQNMMDSITIVREEGIESPADVERRLHSTGAAFSRAKAALNRNTHVKEKMEDLKQAIVQYEKTRDLAQVLYQMPDGPQKNERLKEHAQELNRYKEAMAVMYAHAFHEGQLDAEIADFKRRWRQVESNLQKATRHYDETRESYRKLKKLHYNMSLAENAKYCYGPEYTGDFEKAKPQSSRARHLYTEEKEPQENGKR